MAERLLFLVFQKNRDHSTVETSLLRILLMTSHKNTFLANLLFDSVSYERKHNAQILLQRSGVVSYFTDFNNTCVAVCSIRVISD